MPAEEGEVVRAGSRTRRAHRALLALLLVFCVVSRGGYVLYATRVAPEVTREPDTVSYLGPAEALAEEGRFDRAPDDPRPEFLRTPGYPLFLAAVRMVFGPGATPVLLVQVLLSALAVVAVYVLGSRLWSAKTGLLAALIVTFDPLQFTTAGTVLTESITALLLVLVGLLGYFTLARGDRRPWCAAGLGLTLAAATMVRPVTYYLLFVTVGVVAWRLRQDRWPLRRALVVVLAFAVPVVAVVGGWQVRNHERVGSWRLSGIEGKNLYEWRAAGVVAEVDDVPLEDARTDLRAELGPIGENESQGAYRGREYAEAMTILRAHPGAAVEVTVRGLWDELFHVDTKLARYLRIEKMNGVVVAAEEVVLVVFWVAAAYGAWATWRHRRDLLAHAFVAGTALYVLVASAGPEAYGGRGERFRAPVVPLVALYAAYGVSTAWNRRRRSRATAGDTRDGRSPTSLLSGAPAGSER